ncbi:FkbM family methyltransferase [Luteolibacter sp. SL250]|uniref:FkbM family methyltransferase n=1 Tax=Luteolibacter sp. SL250 TaxID=2995170 RepID=UPI0022718207|nr:FkbM family methyltransferase [Luteolibacter sp. SL250]WAC20449.1 FkbM family methyltransferase [Luteolibacter sp. SL250]
MKQMESFGNDLVLDVGANAGQFGQELREAGYRGDIHSFEPLDDAFAILAQTAARDARWNVKNCALGAERGESVIHVSNNSFSSSLLGMLPTHEEAAPESKYVRDQKISVETLDHLFPDIVSRKRSIWLKIDTQGFENQVIAGAKRSLAQIDTVQMEVSLTPLYDGALSIEQMISMMSSHGYCIVDVEPEFCDQATGRLFQVNLTFHRY